MGRYVGKYGRARVSTRASQHGQPKPSGFSTLNCGKLKADRRRALRIYRGRDPEFLEELMDLEEEARKLFISQEIKNTRTEPYYGQ